MKKLFLFVLAVLLPVISVFASMKEMSAGEWKIALEEIGGKTDKKFINSITRSSETLDKINLETKGVLTTEEWINIFKKLDLEPKADMQTKEWELFFGRIGLNKEFDAATEAPAISTGTTNQEVRTKPENMKPDTSFDKSSTIATSSKASSVTPDIYATAQVKTEALPSKPSLAETPKTPAFEPAKPQEHARSSRISFDLKGMDILSVLKMISQKSDLNIIAGNNVKGSVTIYLKDVDARDALKMILEMNDLAYVYEDKVIKVMTATDYEKVYGKKFYDRTAVEIVKLNFGKADNVLKTLTNVKSKIGQIIADSASNSLIIIDTRDNINDIKKMIKTLDVKIDTKAFPLSYARAKDIADKFKNVISPNIGDIQIDERSNQLIITDSENKLADIAVLVASLDKRHKEVLIEARIVQLQHGNQNKIGINWESVFSKINDQAIAGRVVANLGNIKNIPIKVGGDNGIQLNVGTLNTNNFSAIIDVLQTVGKTDLVASPRIAAIENKEARILVGTKEAYVTTQIINAGTSTVSPVVAESVNFVDVGMKLFVTPNIGDDGYITMKIRPELSSVDRLLTTSQNNEIPILRTSESETTVMVQDGVTIVIAGLTEETEIKKVEGIPLLCRIPLIGSLFGRTSTEKSKSELIVFLTPRLMSGNLSSEEAKK
ncbi:MAG: hypothetical protein LHV68_06430 [Elusimicrobia bacterium]|nr:hypothetical protein [Candidatus Liberimonas magnetica]